MMTSPEQEHRLMRRSIEHPGTREQAILDAIRSENIESLNNLHNVREKTLVTTTMSAKLKTLNADFLQDIVQKINALKKKITGKNELLRQLDALKVECETVQKNGGSNVSLDSLQGAQHAMSGMLKEFSEGGMLTKSAYIGTGVFGFGIVNYLYRKIFGNGKEDGLLKKAGKWLASLGGMAMGILTGKSIVDWWNKEKTSATHSLVNAALEALGIKPPAAPPGEKSPITAGDVVDTGRDLARGASGALLKAGGNATEPLTNLWNNSTKIVQNFRDGKIADGMIGIATSGCTFAYEKGKFLLYDVGYTACIELPLTSAENVIQWIQTGNRPDTFWEVWGASGAMYYVAKNAARGDIKALLPIFDGKDAVNFVAHTIGGPLHVFQNATKTVLTTAYVASIDGGTDALRLRYLKYNLIGKTSDAYLRSRFGNAISNENDAILAVHKVSELMADLQLMKRFDETKNGCPALFTKREIETVEETMKIVAQRVQVFCSGTASLQNAMLQEIAESNNIKETQEYIKKIEEALSAHRGSPHAPSQVSSVAGSTNQSSPVANASAPGSSNNATRAAPNVAQNTSKNALTRAISNLENKKKIDSKTKDRLLGLVNEINDTHSFQIASDALEDAPTMERITKFLVNNKNVKNVKITDTMIATVVSDVHASERLTTLLKSVDSVQGLEITDDFLVKITSMNDAQAKNVVQFIDEMKNGKSGTITTEILGAVTECRAPRLAAKVVRDSTNAGTNLARVQKISTISRQPFRFGGAVALELGSAALDVMELKDMEVKIDETKKRIRDIISRVTLPGTKEAAFTEKVTPTGLVFTHKEIPSITINLASIHQNLDALQTGATVNAMTSGASLATTILAPSFVLGPGGLAIAAVCLSVRGLSSLRDQAKKVKLLTSMPTPLLALLGMAGAVGGSEYHWLADASNTLYGADTYDRRTLRKKALVTMFTQEMQLLGQQYPHVYQDIQIGRAHV